MGTPIELKLVLSVGSMKIEYETKEGDELWNMTVSELSAALMDLIENIGDEPPASLPPAKMFKRPPPEQQVLVADEDEPVDDDDDAEVPEAEERAPLRPKKDKVLARFMDEE